MFPSFQTPDGVKFVRNFGGHFQTHPGAAIDAGGVCLPTPRLGCRTSSQQRRRTSRGAAPTPFRDPRRSGADAGQSEQCEGDYQTAGGAKSIRTALDSLSLPSVAHQLKHHIENELHLTAATQLVPLEYWTLKFERLYSLIPPFISNQYVNLEVVISHHSLLIGMYYCFK